MRRGRIIALLAVLCAATGVVGIMPGTAAAASPIDICRDLADGQLNGTYSAAEQAAYQVALRSDPTIQGYCNPLVTVFTPPTPPPGPCTEVSFDTAGATLAPNGKYYINAPNGNVAECGPAPQPPATCVEVPAGTQGATQAPNGKYYTNLPSGGAAACGPATPAPQQCVEVSAGTAGAVQAPNGKYYTNIPSGGPAVCGPAAAGIAPASAAPAPAATPSTGVLGATKVKTTKPAAAVAPATHTAAPLAATRTTGTLPFTGAELTIFAIVGLALLGGGLALRMTARQHRSRA
jgi:hypothetical protein